MITYEKVAMRAAGRIVRNVDKIKKALKIGRVCSKFHKAGLM
jgi:hypothetical protein